MIIYRANLLTFIIGGLVTAYTAKSITNDYKILESIKVSLATANHELQGFIYRTSHDFKSPILCIGSMVRFIEEDLKSGDINEVLSNLKRIKNNALSLEGLVSGALLLAKTDLSDNHIVPIQLGELITSIYSRLDGLAEKHQVELKIDDNIHPDIISSDRNHLTTALENIISDGIKYSDGTRNNSFVAVNVKNPLITLLILAIMGLVSQKNVKPKCLVCLNNSTLKLPTELV